MSVSLTRLKVCAIYWLSAWLLPGALTSTAAARDMHLLSYVVYGDRAPKGGQAMIALYRLVDGRLRPVPLTVEPPAWTDFVLVDPEMRLLVLAQTTGMPLPLEFMSMDDPGRLGAGELNMTGWMAGLAYIESLPDEGRALIFNLFSDGPTHGKPAEPDKVMAFMPSIGKWIEKGVEIYKYLRITGGAEGPRKGFTNAMGLRQSGDGQLITFGGRGTLPIGPPLPSPLRFSPREGTVLLLGNSKFMAVANVTLFPERHAIPYRMLDRRTNTWTQLDIPGNESWNVRAFGPWMAGIIDEGLHDKPFRLSPGRHKLDPRAPLETVDQYLEVEQIYRTGRLFLYNIETRHYYEWDTHDGDCEIILVEDGQVYYRVDQTIYRARIGAKTLEKPEVLVEGGAVPGIHWAFFGPGEKD